MITDISHVVNVCWTGNICDGITKIRCIAKCRGSCKAQLFLIFVLFKVKQLVWNAVLEYESDSAGRQRRP